MWIRLRLDISLLDLAFAFFYCLTPKKRSEAVKRARGSWSVRDDFLITLSVRSSFDLALRALQLPRGSEVLLSALTIPDMVRIVEMHGLIPIPVDIDEAGNISAVSLRQAISSKARMIVVAHLFGGKTPLDDVLKIAHDHKLFVVEDCAQSFDRVGDFGHPASDLAMFSFGPIKTASALGGAVVRVRSEELRERMNKILNGDPIQSRGSFLLRLARFTMLKLLSGKRAAKLTRLCVERFGIDFDNLANTVVRGFSSTELFVQLRRQPTVPLLRLLERRWRTYDFARIERRRELGRDFDRRIGRKQSASHSYWVYPIFVCDPIGVRDRLRAAGFDATCEARMRVVPSTDESRKATSASDLWKCVVFLPWYPEIPQSAVHEMSHLICNSDTATKPHKAQPNSAIHAGALNAHEFNGEVVP